LRAQASLCGFIGPSPHPFNKHIGQSCRAIRKSKNFSIEKLSDLIGVEERDLLGFEEGSIEIRLEDFFWMCRILNINPDQLFRDYIDEPKRI